MSTRWLESLDPKMREEAEQLIERLRVLGCPEPENWARRELKDDVPQISRLVLLRHLWSEAINTWRDSPLWIDNLSEDSRTNPASPFSEAGRALADLLALGGSRKTIGLLARFVAYETVFSVIHTLDEGYDPEQEEQVLPGWALVERNPLGHVTGRQLTHLHEDLPRMEPKDDLNP